MKVKTWSAADLKRKRRESIDHNNSVEPFIDPEGYKAYIDRQESRFRAQLEGG